MFRTLVISSACNGMVQVQEATFGRDSSVRVGGRVAGEEGGESRPDRSMRISGGVAVFSFSG